MIRSMMSIIAASRQKVDPDAAALVAAILGDGGTLTTTERSAINYFIPYLKIKSIWSQIKALYLMVGGDAIGCKYNAKDPRDLDAAFRLTFFNSPTITSNGVQWNGSSQYAETYCSISNALDPASLHLSYYSRVDDNTNIGTEIGVYETGVYQLDLQLNFGGQAYFEYPNGNENHAAAVRTDGAFTGSKELVNYSKFYHGSTQLATSTGINTYNGASTLNLARLNVYNGSYSNRECAGASIGLGLTDQMCIDLNVGWQAFNTILGRQV